MRHWFCKRNGWRSNIVIDGGIVNDDKRKSFRSLPVLRIALIAVGSFAFGGILLETPQPPLAQEREQVNGGVALARDHLSRPHPLLDRGGDLGVAEEGRQACCNLPPR